VKFLAKDNLGLVHVYTGGGKGKTSASMGLALRAVGQGLKVYVIQFMKGGAYTGEFIAGKNFLPNIRMKQYGKKCIKEDKQMKLAGFDSGYQFFDYVRDDIKCGDCRYCFVNDDDQKKFCVDAMDHAQKVLSSDEYDMVILDEINVAAHLGYVEMQELIDLIRNKHKDTELVLTGRDAPRAVMEVADYVSQINMVKHPFQKGIGARRGIEY